MRCALCRPESSLPAIYLKQVPYTMAQLVTYDSVTRSLAARLASDGGGGEWATVGVALGGAACAALVASLASQPGDTLLSKLNQGRRAAHATLAHARSRRAKACAGAGAGAGAGGAGSALTSSDDELELGAMGGAVAPGGPATPGGATSASCAGDECALPGSSAGGGGGSALENALAAPSPRGDALGPTFRAAGGGGCGPMCALAARLGPAGLMLGWDARLAHTGTIVLVQLLIYDAVKAAVGLPVSAHGGHDASDATARRLLLR
jgi:hypothetical protein